MVTFHGRTSLPFNNKTSHTLRIGPGNGGGSHTNCRTSRVRTVHLPHREGIRTSLDQVAEQLNLYFAATITLSSLPQ